MRCLNGIFSSSRDRDGLPDADCEAHGLQELSRQALGSRRGPRFDDRHLLGQDGNLDSEHHDRLAPLVQWRGENLNQI